MAIVSKPQNLHWNYFLALEMDLLKISRYIEFHEENYKCFSIENSRLLMSASAEVDVICKQLIENIAPNSSKENIHDYQKAIPMFFPTFSSFEVEIPRFQIKLIPWSNWKQTTKQAPQASSPPDWWTAHNKVKHHRNDNYKDATLEHTINSVAALYICCLCLYMKEAKEGSLPSSPCLFAPISIICSPSIRTGNLTYTFPDSFCSHPDSEREQPT